MQVNSASTPSSSPLGLEPTHDGMVGVDGGVQRQASVTPIRPHVWRHQGQEGHGLHARAHIFKRPAQTSGGWLSRIRHAMQMRVEKVQIQSLQRHAALIPANGHVKSTGWLHGLTDWRAHLREVVASLKGQMVPVAPVTTAVTTATVSGTAGVAAAAAAVNPSDASALASVTVAVHQRFTAQAGNKEAFNELLHKAFGDKFDAAKAETIRQQALAGDFSWAPKVEVVRSATLADRSGTQAAGAALGAYAQETDTIYISRELLHSDPSHAGRILMEEMGHGIDARINTSDAVGDEGEIFSKLMHGDKISAQEMAALKVDNDSGVVNINGRNVTVEYGWLSKAFKAVTGGIKRVVKAVVNGAVNLAKAAVNVTVGLATMNFDRVRQGFQQGITAIKTTVKEVHQAVKDTAKELRKIAKEAFMKLMQSKLFAAVLMICRFIPIPIVQLVVRIIDIVRAAYMVYQGIKNKSLSMVLGGVASIAGGVANVAGSLGASMATVDAIKGFAQGASNLSMAYNAVANKDLGSALGLLGGMTNQGTTLNTMAGYAQQAVGVGQAIRTGDTLAAVGGTLGLAGAYNGKTTELGQRLGQVQDAVTGVRALRELDRGNLDAAQSLASSTNLAQKTSNRTDEISKQQRAEAAAKEAAEQAKQAELQKESKPVEEDANDREASAADAAKPVEPANEASKPSTSTSIKLGSDARLETIAREHYGENWRAGLVLMVVENGIKMNQWGSPVLREGKTLVINDLGERSTDELAKLNRMGGNIVAGNSRGLQAKADLEERVRQAVQQKAQEAKQFAAANTDAAATGVCSPGNPQGLTEGQIKAQVLAELARPSSVLDVLRAPVTPSTGTIGPAPNYVDSMKGIVGSNLPLSDKLSMAWGNTKYYFRGSDTAQGMVQVVGGGLEVAGAAGLTSTGVGTVVAVPLALHGGDNIGTGLNRIFGDGDGQTVTYKGVYAATGSQTIAHGVDQGIPLIGGIASLGQGLRLAENQVLNNSTYRALTSVDARAVEQGAGLTAKAPNGMWTAEEHVLNYSPTTRGGAQLNSPWISTTSEYDIAAHGYNSGNGVVAVNLGKVSNGNQVEVWKDVSRSNSYGESMAYHRSIWAQETSIYQSVPGNAIYTPFAPLSQVSIFPIAVKGAGVGGAGLLEQGKSKP
jgi:hypothetical protein